MAFTVRQWLNNDELAIDIWEKKYRYMDETFDQWLDRVSGSDQKVRKLIFDKKFIFGGRILANRWLQHTGKGVTYSNCYVLTPPEDNLESIFEAGSKMARVFSYGGGVGLDLSKLCPAGSRVNNAAEVSSGAISFMEFYSLITALISQKGRRGALLLSLDINHPDVIKFIEMKSEPGQIEKANISVRVDDSFMVKVMNELIHTTKYIRKETEQEIISEIPAKDLLEKISYQAWNMAEPGLLFWDKIKNWSLLSNYEDFEFSGTNPCGEMPLPSGGACNLGAINLAEFVINQFTPYARVDENELAKTVNIAIIALNECLDEGMELHPLQEQRESVAKWRQVGLGIMGFADMLIKMGVEYGSDRCCEIIDFVGKTILWQAVRTSSKLAKSKGSYPEFNAGRVVNTDFAQANFSDGLMDEIIQQGLCNSQLLTIAPTGTISTMLGVSGGMEPLFDTAYLRKTESLHGEDHYYRVKTPIAIIADSHGIKEDQLAVAHKISPADRIKVQAAWQRWIDASISSTINLPATATVEDVFEIYKNAWESGLKGVTVYREGCARGAILSKVEPQAQLPGTLVRETNDNVLGLKRRLTTGCGSLWCTAFFDRDSAELVEVFLSKGSTGGCNNFMVSLSRMLSLAARAGVEVEQIVDQLHSCGTCPSYAVRRALNKDASKGSCCPAAVGYALMDMSAEMRANLTDKAVKITSQDVTEGMKCPQCKSPMSMVEGCVMCRSCGFSRCS